MANAKSRILSTFGSALSLTKLVMSWDDIKIVYCSSLKFEDIVLKRKQIANGEAPHQ